jgi:glutamate dehydrogenase (NAD(P)+)
VTDIFELADALGPLKTIHVHEPSAGLRGILVIDNVAIGPSIGGVRMAPDVSAEECFRLARAMTLKNAAAGLPHGGGKAVLYGDPNMPKDNKQRLIRAFASVLRNVDEYIFGPDMGTNEECMAWVHDEIGRAVGLPAELGGIPLDEIGATGFGMSHVTDVALEYCNFELEGARIAVQGFGAVGMHAARFLTDKGAVLIAAADSRGTIHNRGGLDVSKLIELKSNGGSLADYPDARTLGRHDIIDIECEIWIPAARPDVIREDNVGRLRTKLVVQGANIPITEAAEKILADRGVLNIPDFIANAGGVICAAVEYQGATEAAALATIEQKLRRNTQLVLETAKKQGVLPRQAAVDLARTRVEKAMGFRRFSSFSTAPGFA